MFHFVLLAFACFILWEIVYRTREMRPFGITIFKQAIWVISILCAFLGLFAAFIPRLSWAFPMFPVPYAIAYFLPPILCGRILRTQLVQHGTLRTRELEKVALFSIWLGVFSLCMMAVTWLISLAGASIASGSIRR